MGDLRRTEARDAILTQFKTAWDADSVASLLPVFYRDAKRNGPVSDLQPFARVSVVHATGQQDALANGYEQAIFKRQGVLIAQIFTLQGSGLTDSDYLAKVVADAFEGQNNGDIWYRNVRINEVGPDGDRFQTNVVVDFQYDEIK